MAKAATKMEDMNLCKCGCGKVTNKDKEFIVGHNSRTSHPNWKGGRRIDSLGYIGISIGKEKYQREHDIIAEKILGRSLRKNEMCHHINGQREFNQNFNLIICTKGFHQTLHFREIALKISGHANWRKCKFCHQYDDPKNLTFYSKTAPLHRSCKRLFPNYHPCQKYSQPSKTQKLKI